MEIPTHSPFEGVKELESSQDLVDRLMKKIEQALERLRGLRKPIANEVFKPVCYISPFDVEIEHPLRKPVSIFNPGAMLSRSGKLWIFPRIIPGYFWYPSAVGFFEVDIDKLLEGVLEKPIKVSVVLYPRYPWDIGGCEDARASYLNNDIAILYTGIVPGVRKFHVYGGRSTQCIAILKELDLKLIRSGFLTIEVNGSKYLPSDWRDSAFIEGKGSEWSFLTRINVKGVMVCWKSVLNIDTLTINIDTLEPVFVNEPWEQKVGWSTNAVKIGSDEYLVGWHGVQEIDKRYLNGLAIVDSEGNVKAITNYLLVPSRIEEYYGDRPGVIFGDGLVVYKDRVIWIGGVADQMIGVFVAELKDVMESMIWIEKR